MATNEHSILKEHLKAARHDANSTKKRLADTERINEDLRMQVRILDEELCRKDQENMKLETQLAQSEYEILKLKAMLFDLMYSRQIAG